jgi:hypothetical protein
MILVIAKYISCSVGTHHCTDPAEQLIVIFLVVEGLLFGLFTLCMLGDQMSSVYSNQTQIDRLKGTKYEQHGEVNEVCGGPIHSNFQFHWLWPEPVNFKNQELHEQIYGFRCEEREEMSPLLVTTGTVASPARQRKVQFFL